MGVGGKATVRPAALLLGRRPGTDCTEGWVVVGAGLDVQVGHMSVVVGDTSKLQARSESQRLWIGVHTERTSCPCHLTC
jgi:hypothetical protein